MRDKSRTLANLKLIRGGQSCLGMQHREWGCISWLEVCVWVFAVLGWFPAPGWLACLVLAVASALLAPCLSGLFLDGLDRVMLYFTVRYCG